MTAGAERTGRRAGGGGKSAERTGRRTGGGGKNAERTGNRAREDQMGMPEGGTA